MTKPWESPQPASNAMKYFFAAKEGSVIQDHTTMPYGDYLQTDHWKIKREEALFAAIYRCQVCNRGQRLHVHHRTYERRGCELLSDLTVLCEDCHELFHNHRTLSSD